MRALHRFNANQEYFDMTKINKHQRDRNTRDAIARDIEHALRDNAYHAQHCNCDVCDIDALTHAINALSNISMRALRNALCDNKLTFTFHDRLIAQLTRVRDDMYVERCARDDDAREQSRDDFERTTLHDFE
jgi:hypothetical protein